MSHLRSDELMIRLVYSGRREGWLSASIRCLNGSVSASFRNPSSARMISEPLSVNIASA